MHHNAVNAYFADHVVASYSFTHCGGKGPFSIGCIIEP